MRRDEIREGKGEKTKTEMNREGGKGCNEEEINKRCNVNEREEGCHKENRKRRCGVRGRKKKRVRIRKRKEIGEMRNTKGGNEKTGKAMENGKRYKMVR